LSTLGYAGAPYSPIAMGFWFALGSLQAKYLAGAYLTQVHLIDEIHLMKDMDKVRIRTIFHSMKTNIFAFLRLSLFKSDEIKKEYIFDIKDL
jgi:hypothetical protein